MLMLLTLSAYSQIHAFENEKVFNGIKYRVVLSVINEYPELEVIAIYKNPNNPKNSSGSGHVTTHNRYSINSEIFKLNNIKHVVGDDPYVDRIYSVEFEENQNTVIIYSSVGKYRLTYDKYRYNGTNLLKVSDAPNFN